MQKIYKCMLVFACTFLISLYLLFLIIPPVFVNLDKCKTDIQQLAKDYSGLNFDYSRAKVVTTPSLSVGLNVENVSISIPESDESVCNVEKIKVFISLPSLLFKTLNIVNCEVYKPSFNLDINTSGSQYEIVEFLNNQAKNNSSNVIENAESQSYVTNEFSDFKIKVSKFYIYEYVFKCRDKSNNSYIRISGDECFLKFVNNILILKVQPELYYNDNKNIVSDIFVTSFIPDFSQDEFDKDSEHQNNNFINIVDVYGKYNLKSDIKVNLSIKKANNSKVPSIDGVLNIDKFSINTGAIQLPESYLHLNAKNNSLTIDTKVYMNEKTKAEIEGMINYGKSFSSDLKVKTDKLYFEDLLSLCKAFLESFGIKNNLSKIKMQGYVEADCKVKSNEKKIAASGFIDVVGCELKELNSGLYIKDAKSKLLFQNNMLKLTETSAYINNMPIKAEGFIDENTSIKINIFSKKMPLRDLYKAFAPVNLKQNYSVGNGYIDLNIDIKGTIQKPKANIKAVLSNIILKDNINDFAITNEKSSVNLLSDFKTFNGTIENKNFNLDLNSLQAKIKNKSLLITFTENGISIKPTEILLNDASKINISGQIKNYVKSPEIKISGEGNISALSLKQFAGKDFEPYIKASGSIPLKISIIGDDKKQNLNLKMYASSTNYVTPVDIEQIFEKKSLLQINADIDKNRLIFTNTGLYSGVNSPDEIEIIKLSGGINLDKDLSLNNIRVATKNTQKMSICAFKDSSLDGKVDVTISGTALKPVMKGFVSAQKIKIPELMTTIQNAEINLNNKVFNFNLDNLNLNGSEININGNGLLDYKPVVTVSFLNVNSTCLNADKVFLVAEASEKLPVFAVSSTQEQQNLPISILSGYLNIKKLNSGQIEAENINSKMQFANNVLFLQDLRAEAFGGNFKADISTNILSSEMKVKVSGENMDANKAINACAGMKGLVLGNLGFNADITIQGNDYIEQIKTLNGKADFYIENGQFGTLGRFENFLKADNLAAISFISTKIGSLINAVSPHNTAQFDYLKGNVSFKNGFMTIDEVTSSGKNMSLYINGNMNLVNNNANINILGRISPVIADLLGPLNQFNPVNILQSSNSILATVTQNTLKALNQSAITAEVNKIPHLVSYANDKLTSKFFVKIEGNIEQPHKVVKSFKWLNSKSEIQQAEEKISPVKTVTDVINSIPKTKDETVNKLKETGKNTLQNLGRQLFEETKKEYKTYL